MIKYSKIVQAIMWEKSPTSEIKERLYCLQVSELQNDIDIAVYNMRIVKLLD